MRITLCDVGPRDGLQNDPVQLEPAVRAELVDRLSETGLPRIETTSFVNPKAVPRMAGAAEVMGAITRKPGVIYAALVLNGRGLDDAIAADADEIHVAYPLTNTHASFSGSPSAFYFDALGRASASSTISITGYSTSITVESETGYVHP